jgi:hypothetical protein
VRAQLVILTLIGGFSLRDIEQKKETSIEKYKKSDIDKVIANKGWLKLSNHFSCIIAGLKTWGD